jgi:hypothetical protein
VIPAISAELLVAIRTGDTSRANRLWTGLADLDQEQLSASLTDDATRTATWLNLYNAATQRLIETDPERFSSRLRFFRRPAAIVAGQALSLDAIEHGLLRRSRWKVGLGWLGNPFPGRFERRFRVDAVDARIHFALNCAAASCPPIAAYDAGRLDAQLDLATRAYLAATVRREPRRLLVPRLFLWFMGDFGGPRGVRRFLERHGVETGRARLRFARYDWSLQPAAWAGSALGDDDDGASGSGRPGPTLHRD